MLQKSKTLPVPVEDSNVGRKTISHSDIFAASNAHVNLWRFGLHLNMCTLFSLKCYMLQAVYLEIINFIFFFSGSQIVGDEVMQVFMKERELNGDLISKASDALWRRGGFSSVVAETNIVDENSEVLEVSLSSDI